MTLHDYFTVLKTSCIEFVNDNVLKLSASLAYYTVFSMPSVLILIVSLGSLFYGHDAIEGQIVNEINNFVGSQTAQQIQDILKNTTLSQNNILATLVGGVILLISATGMFTEIQDSLNSIWGLKTKSGKALTLLLLNRLVSFSMLLVLGFVLLVSLLLNALLSVLVNNLHHYFFSAVQSVLVIDHVLMLLVTTLLFGFIFKALPDGKIVWKDVWLGAFFTAVLFMLGKFLIGFYLSHTSVISTYGAAGSLIVILLWVYYSSIILYFGAEFTQAYVLFKRKKIEPNKYATWVGKKSNKPENKA